MSLSLPVIISSRPSLFTSPRKISEVGVGLGVKVGVGVSAGVGVES